MSWLLEATLSNALVATAMALVVVALARFLRHRPAVVHAMWLIVLLKLVTPPLVSVPVKFGWEARPAFQMALPESAVEFIGDVPLGAETGDRQSGAVEEVSESDVAALVAELQRMRAASDLQSTTISKFWLPSVLILWLVGTVVWTMFAAVRIVRFSWLLRAARPCSHDVAAIANRTARKLGLRKTPAIVTVDARIPPLVWHAGRAPRIVLPSDLAAQWNNEQIELVLAHELAHVKRGDHLVRWFTLAVLALYWWHPLAWWAVRRLRVAEEQCCDAMVVAASPSRAHAYAETLLETVDFLAARRSPPHVLASGIGSGGSLKRRCEMILSGQTKFRTGGIAGVLLLLAAVAVLPLAGDVRADDKSGKKNFNERLRRLEQLVEKLVGSKEKETDVENPIVIHKPRKASNVEVRFEDGHRITYRLEESGKYRYRFPFSWVDAEGRKHEGDIEETYRDAKTAMSSLKAHLAAKQSELQSEVNKLTAEIVRIQLHILKLNLKEKEFKSMEWRDKPTGGAAALPAKTIEKPEDFITNVYRVEVEKPEDFITNVYRVEVEKREDSLENKQPKGR